MELAKQTAELLGLKGEEAESFVKSAEEKLAGIMGMLGKKAVPPPQTGQRIRDMITVGVLGGAGLAAIDDTLFAKSKERRRYKNMMAEAGQRGYSDLTDAPDQEMVNAAFHIVNSYSPSLSQNPILAANATRYILHKGIAGEGGLAPDAIPNMMAAQEALSGYGRDPQAVERNANKFMEAAGRIVESMG